MEYNKTIDKYNKKIREKSYIAVNEFKAKISDYKESNEKKFDDNVINIINEFDKIYNEEILSKLNCTLTEEKESEDKKLEESLKILYSIEEIQRSIKKDIYMICTYFMILFSVVIFCLF